MKPLVNGSGGPIGSECAELPCQAGWNSVGLDSNMPWRFFGEGGSVELVIGPLQQSYRSYRHDGSWVDRYRR